MKPKRIGVLTGGGDCPGLNAAIRAVVKTAIIEYGLEVVGIQDGFYGLIYDQMRELKYEDVSGILMQGGTLLGASNKDNPFRQPIIEDGQVKTKNCVPDVLRNIQKNHLDALVVIGGDGSQNIAYSLSKEGVSVVGVPKTIDNDLAATDVTIGFHTAVATATEAIDKLHTTALSHNRIMVIEVMGRYAGWLTLYAGVAGGGDVILIPEIPYDLNVICERAKERSQTGKRFTIVVVSEGAKPAGGKMVVQEIDPKRTDPVRLGGIGNLLAHQIEAQSGLETRASILGHLVRGGSPTPEDRLLATQFGKKAIDLIMQEKFGYCVVSRGGRIEALPLKDTVEQLKLVPKDHSLIQAAKAVGTSFGTAKF